MARIYMVRHGKAAAGFTDDVDPGLDATGLHQAQEAASVLCQLPVRQILTSPLARARETAAPLARELGMTPVIEDRVAEVPSPGMGLEERGTWLSGVMAGRWSEQTADLQAWQQTMQSCLVSLDRDTAIFSHFVAINAMTAAATGSDDVLVFRPDNGSITVFEAEGTSLRLISRGDERSTHVN